RAEAGLRALERRLERLVDAYRVLRLPGEPAPRYAAVVSHLPAALLAGSRSRRQARVELVLRLLRRRGPVTKYEVMDRYGFSERFVEEVLAELVAGGAVVSGEYLPTKAFPQFCYRAHLEEIHRRTLERLRRELEPAAPEEYADFLTRWQHVHPEARLAGVDGLRQVIGQLQGLENYQLVYERHLFPARIRDYEPALLDRLCYGGEVTWRRFDSRQLKRGYIGFGLRRDLAWLVPEPPADAPVQWDEDLGPALAAARQYLAECGTCFFDDLARHTGLEEGLALRAVWHLAWTGEATCDSYEAVRHAEIGSGLSGSYDLATRPGGVALEAIVRHLRRRRLDPRLGRWIATERLRPAGFAARPAAERAERWARLLLDRWGLACRDLARREVGAPEWRDLRRALKRGELLGKLQRGYFVDGLSGEQYIAPEALEALRAAKMRRLAPEAEAPDAGGDGPGPAPEGREPAAPTTSPTAAGDLLLLDWCDPAHPFDGLFPLCTELGEDVRRRLRFLRSPFKHLVLRDGQPVLLYDRGGAVSVLAGLSRAEATACLRLLGGLADPAGAAAGAGQVRVTEWNAHPIDVSPARHLLAALGFGPDPRAGGGLVWDGAPRGGDDPGEVGPARYECLGREEAPVAYDADWVVARSPQVVRPVVRRLLERLAELLPDACELTFGPRGFHVLYRGVRCVTPQIQQQKVNLRVTHRGWVAPIEIRPDTDLESEDFATALLGQFERSRQRLDAELDRRRPTAAPGDAA
ncbi:MAG: hypothetical protein ABIL09_29950, partial [Gemmatimonadota bacterium]